MHTAHLPLCLFALVISCLSTSTYAFPDFGIGNKNFGRGLGSSWTSRSQGLYRRLDSQSGVNFNPNGSAFLWLPQDTYEGQTFFDGFTFFNARDLTNGHVNYVDRNTAFSKNLTYVDSHGKIIMKADNFTALPLGTFRDSVRISSNKSYTTGLFVLDIDKAPWGCAVWPAFWTVGPNWPSGGEIDILEGVHDNEHNQVAWHTDDGCYLDPNATFTGQLVQDNGANRTNCYGYANSNSGCDITEWSHASYGPYFEAQGGGVLAMKWDENSISVWSFYRAAVPKDITSGQPNPSQWGQPSATLLNTTCNLSHYFWEHSIVFDITFCGDWAGNSYATSGCPGTCDQRLTNPANFVNATWSINSLKVYKKQPITNVSSSPGVDSLPTQKISMLVGLSVAFLLVFTML